VSEIRKLTGKQLDEFITIVGHAYPAMKIDTPEEKQRALERLSRPGKGSRISLYGLFRRKKMLGVMRLHDFTMNLFATRIPAGGVGMVAVDLMHKKEKVCKEMILYFLEHYRDRGAPIVLLWPFRPDFYRNMGFGYGAKINQYRVKPEALPRGKTKEHIRFLSKKDAPAIIDCYQRYFDKTNGMVEGSVARQETFMDLSPALRFAGYEKKGKILGYLAFDFEPVYPGNYVTNDLHIREFIYESPEVLAEMMTFLRSQSDQVNRVVFETNDEDLHHLFIDPRNQTGNLVRVAYHECNTGGIGVMYRVIDTASLFRALAAHDFGSQTCRVKLAIKDSFLKSNDRNIILHFENGKAELKPKGKFDFEVGLDISDFSSLLMGAVSFRSLYNYGRVGISDAEHVETMNRIFVTEGKPVCLASF